MIQADACLNLTRDFCARVEARIARLPARRVRACCRDGALLVRRLRELEHRPGASRAALRRLSAAATHRTFCLSDLAVPLRRSQPAQPPSTASECEPVPEKEHDASFVLFGFALCSNPTPFLALVFFFGEEVLTCMRIKRTWTSSPEVNNHLGRSSLSGKVASKTMTMGQPAGSVLVVLCPPPARVLVSCGNDQISHGTSKRA